MRQSLRRVASTVQMVSGGAYRTTLEPQGFQSRSTKERIGEAFPAERPLESRDFSPDTEMAEVDIGIPGAACATLLIHLGWCDRR